MTGVGLSDEVRADPSVAAAVAPAERVVLDVLGPAVPDGTVEWAYRPGDYGRRHLVLRARATDRQAEEVFRPDELNGNGAFEYRLRGMKDALEHNRVWRAAVTDLMARVDQWSGEIPGAVVERGEVELYEQRSGRYRLPSRVIRAAGWQVAVEPAGGWVMTPTWVEDAPGNTSTALGRVDLLGIGGPIYLYFLSPPAAGWVYQGRVLHKGAHENLFYDLDRDDFLRIARVLLDE